MKIILVIIYLLFLPAALNAFSIMPIMGSSGIVTQPASWDLLDLDCSATTGWTINDVGSTTVSPAGQWFMDSGETSADNNEYTNIYRDVGSIPDTFTVEVKIYHNALGTISDIDRFVLAVYQADEGVSINCGTDGMFTRTGGSTFTEIGTNLVKIGEWQTWRFCVTFTGTAGAGTFDIYLNDSTHSWEKVGDDLSCSNAGAPAGGDGTVSLYQFGYATNSRQSHIDYIKISSGLTPP